MAPECRMKFQTWRLAFFESTRTDIVKVWLGEPVGGRSVDLDGWDEVEPGLPKPTTTHVSTLEQVKHALNMPYCFIRRRSDGRLFYARHAVPQGLSAESPHAGHPHPDSHRAALTTPASLARFHNDLTPCPRSR